MENGIQKSLKMSPEKNYIQRKQEKTLFERYQNYTAIEWITLLKKQNILYSFSFQNVPLLWKKDNKKKLAFLRVSQLPKADFSGRNEFLLWRAPQVLQWLTGVLHICSIQQVFKR